MAGTELYQVAALYVDPRGPYPGLAADCWDEKRDARDYAGPLPVVAHPPCGPYCKQRHNYRGKQHDCGPIAAEQVRRYGGVLEQPASSKLWSACRLPNPLGRESIPLTRGELGFSIEVEQVAWGHVARKRTWLYFVGIEAGLVIAGLRTDGVPTHWCSGGRKRGKGSGGLVPTGIKVCSAQQRRRTPPAFARWLCELAESARPP